MALSLSCSDDGRPDGVPLGQGGSGQTSGGSGAGGSGAGGVGGSAGKSGSGGAGGTGGTGGVTPTQVFDPSAVYLFAHLEAGGCGGVVAATSDLEDVEGGFPCDAAPLIVRPTDGALLYREGAVLRLWEPDFIAQGYPPEPETNDIPFAAPAGCEPSGAWFDGSEPYFACGAPNRVRTRQGNVDLDGDTLIAVGASGRLLTGSGAQLRLRTGGAVIPMEAGGLPLEVSEIHHVRALSDAFLLLRTPSVARPPSLLRVGLDGSLISLGDYGAVAGVTRVTACLITPDTGAVCLVELGAARGVARFSREAAGEVLHTEQPGDALKLQAAALFTGP
ncbi:MAG: hypothetical protein KIT72_16805 [Polyangiaceae bacterium]|nr:hypothetical protein [Polyangiaceae bacterium]MCW5792079.1 hypothetical protein [Polyangiaceae bacterium]